MSQIVKVKIDLSAPFLGPHEVTFAWDESELSFYLFHAEDSEREDLYFVQPTDHPFPYKANEIELVSTQIVRGTGFHLIRSKGEPCRCN